jgi:hypothetical protein
MSQSSTDGQNIPEQFVISREIFDDAALADAGQQESFVDVETPESAILPATTEKLADTSNVDEAPSTPEEAEQEETLPLVGAGILAVISGNQLPVSFEDIGNFIDMDGGEVCSYDALATRKSALDRIKGFYSNIRLVQRTYQGKPVAEGYSSDGYTIETERVADAYSNRNEILFDESGVPKLQKAGSIKIVTNAASYPMVGLKQLAFWVDAPYTHEGHRAFKELSPAPRKTSRWRSKPAQPQYASVNEYEKATKHAKAVSSKLDDSTIHIGYKIGDDTLLPLISLRRTEEGCEFAIETGQETEGAAYDKPKLVQALRESIAQIVSTRKIDSHVENTLLLPFIIEYIKSLQERAGTKTAIEILEFIHGLKPEGQKMKELSERVLKPTGKSEILEVVTGTQDFAVTTVTEERHVVRRSIPFMTKFGGHDQETEAVLVSNGSAQIEDNPSTDSFTVYMGPRLATFGKSRYYPVYEVTRDKFGFVRMHKYDERFKIEAARAGQEHLDALHTLFIGQPQSPTNA